MHSKSRNDGAIAQLVEQRTENPCVPGSIPGGTTIDKKAATIKIAAFLLPKSLKIALFLTTRKHSSFQLHKQEKN